MTEFRELTMDEAEILMRKYREDLPEDEDNSPDDDVLACRMCFAAERDGETVGMADVYAVDEHHCCNRVFLLCDPVDDRELNDLFSDFSFYAASNGLLKRLRTEYDAQYGTVS